MTRIRNHVKVFACMILLVAAGVAMAQPVRPTEGKNLARGILCSFDPEPNYPDCTDEGDPFDLTDGVYNGCVWSDKGTVGWAVGYGWDVESMPMFLVDIDLGEARPIGKITFDSVTGSSGVTFPLAVRVFVSTDAKHYDLLCNMLTESMPQDKPLTHRFVGPRMRKPGTGRSHLPVMAARRCSGFYEAAPFGVPDHGGRAVPRAGSRQPFSFLP